MLRLSSPIAHLLLSLLAVTPTTAQLIPFVDGFPHDQNVILPPGSISTPPSPADHTFTLRHIYHHGADRYPRLHRKKDVFASHAQVFMAAEEGYPQKQISPLTVKSRADKMERLTDRRPAVVDAMVRESRQNGFVTVAAPWAMEDVSGPDITDKETVINMAIMASNAYVEKEGEGNWEEVGGFYNRTADFGWEGDGLRGHIWADETNTTIVLGLKGTSLAVFDGEGTTTNDKINDNLFFSCCCGQQGQWSWRKVCDCATGPYQCNTTCVYNALQEENRYYTAAKELFSNATELYPNSNVWLAGHSLGGAVASLLGLTYGVPVVTFEAVPEALPAGRLGLPVPPGADPQAPQSRQFTGVYHFGHTADPVFIGTCSGATASCSYAGYAMESACHAGMECIYDVVADKGWRVGIGTHKIHSVIHDVIMKYDKVPECKYTPGCRDCINWKMYKSNGTETTTTSSSSTPTSTSKTRTRTVTCQTPGWWGCLDKSTTTTTSSSSSSSSTSTCKTPGWFGCKDKTTTASSIKSTAVFTTTTAQPSSVTSATTSCETPGHFWGCYDETTTDTRHSRTATELPKSTTAHQVTTTPSIEYNQEDL